MSSFGLPEWMKAPQPGDAGLPSQLTLAQVQELGAQQVQQQGVPAMAFPQQVQQAPMAPPLQSLGAAPGVPAGMSLVNPVSQLPVGAATFIGGQNMADDATGRAELANQLMVRGIGHEDAALRQQVAATNELAQVQADHAHQLKPIDAQRENDATTYQTEYDKLMAESDAANKQQQARVEAAVQQAGEMNIQDFWADKSTGARILGIIAQALSGAANGLAGNPSAPTALDRIINDDLQRQQANQQNKRAVAQQQQGVYQLMLQATGDRRDALLGAQQAANNRTAAMATTLADRMAIPEAQAKAKQFAADMAERNAQLEQKRAEAYQQQASQDANTAAASMYHGESLMAAGNAAAAKAAGGAGGGEYNRLPGALNGVKKNKTTAGIYSKQVKAADDVTSYLATLQDAENALDSGGFEAFYRFTADHDLSYAKGRSDAMLGLGKRLEGPEERMADNMAPGYIKSFLGGDITRAKVMLRTLQDTWGRALVQSYRSADPDVQLDYNAPVIGPVFARVAAADAQKQGGARGKPAAK